MTKSIIKVLPFLLVFFLFPSCSEEEISLAPYNSAERLESLDQLPLTEFIDEAYKSYIMWYPQKVTTLGMDEELGLSGLILDSYDPIYIDQIGEFLNSLLTLLDNYDDDLLEKRLFRLYLEQEINNLEARYKKFPLTLSGPDSYINSLFGFFRRSQSISSYEEAEQYISRLERIEFQIQELDSFIVKQEEMGIIMPVMIADVIYSDLRYNGRVTAEQFPLYYDFKAKVQALGLEPRQERRLNRKALKAIEEHVQIAFQVLERRVELQYDKAPQKVDLLSLPGGEKLYADSFFQATWSSMNPEDLFDLAVSELEGIQGDMYAIFDNMGYDVSRSLFELFDILDTESPYYRSHEVISQYERLIGEAKSFTEGLFPSLDREINVIEREAPGIFVPPNNFFAASRIQQTYKLPTIVFRETYPGNFVRWSLQKREQPYLFQKDFTSSAINEGWALYAEDLVDQLGYYDDKPVDRLAFLKNKAIQAALLATDVGINLKGWSITKATAFMSSHAGLMTREANRLVSPALSSPGGKAASYSGYIEFKNLLMEEKLRKAESFDYGLFHENLLLQGQVPYTILGEALK